MCCAGIIHWKVFETYIGTEMKKRKSDVFAFIGFSFEQKNFFLRKQRFFVGKSIFFRFMKPLKNAVVIDKSVGYQYHRNR